MSQECNNREKIVQAIAKYMKGLPVPKEMPKEISFEIRYEEATERHCIRMEELWESAAVCKNTEAKKRKGSSGRFVRPTVEEVAAYCAERGNGIDAERFVAYYDSNGWKVGKNAMKDWKAAVRTWEKRDSDNRRPAAKHDGKAQSFNVEEGFAKAMERSYGGKS